MDEPVIEIEIEIRSEVERKTSDFGDILLVLSFAVLSGLAPVLGALLLFSYLTFKK